MPLQPFDLSPAGWALALLMTFVAPAACPAQPQTLEWAPTPADNPLKGLVPYADPAKGRFPHSLEFQYFPLSDLMTGRDTYDWQPLEELLDRVAARGNQTVFRVWMEYPGRKDGIPKFLEDDGVKVTEWLCTNTDPFPRQMVRTPDYADERLHAALDRFIRALGRKYDNDPRVGYITAGLLGTWGEWHSYPREDLYPTKEVQRVVMDAYADAFTRTPVLLRYPAGPDNYHYADNHARPFGYHDDSFAWATLDTGRPEDDWYFLPAMKAAGALDKWRTQPIGGEIRPELWDTMFTDQDNPQGQDFDESVQQTHVTWLMDTGMFQQQATPRRREQAIAAVRKMGYDFQVMTADIRPADRPDTPVTREGSSPEERGIDSHSGSEIRDTGDDTTPASRDTPPASRHTDHAESSETGRPRSAPRTAESRGPRFLSVTLTLRNHGVAPFYYDWPIELAALSDAGEILHRWPTDWTLTNLLPGDPDRTWTTTLDTADLTPQSTIIALRAIHPLPNGHPLRFANKSQDQHTPGWLTLVKLPPGERGT